MSLWIDTAFGRYDVSTKEGNTPMTIDTAYESYDTVIRHWLWININPELRNQLKQMSRDYYMQLSIDRRQNMEPLIEKPEKTICKACQYAQAVLVRDLRRVFPSLTKEPALKDRVDEIMSVRPEEISVQLSSPGTNFFLSGVSYIDIENPASAAKIIGLMNSTDTLLDYTSHYTLMDTILLERISEAATPNPS